MKLLSLALSSFFAATLPSSGDEIQSAIDEGIEAYGNEQYSQAASQFELAAQLLREMSGASIAKALPAAPEGWTTDSEPDVQAVGASIMGGMTSASQTYSKDDSHVSIRILSDSPMVGQISMLINNPAMVRQMGQKVIKAGDAKGVLTYDESSSTGSLSAVAMNRYFITVEGNKIDEDTIQEFLGLIDYETLKQQ